MSTRRAGQPHRYTGEYYTKGGSKHGETKNCMTFSHGNLWYLSYDYLVRLSLAIWTSVLLSHAIESNQV